MGRVTHTGILTPGFIVDIATASMSRGGQVGWALVDADEFGKEDGSLFIPAGTVMTRLASGQHVPRSQALGDATHVAFSDMSNTDRSAAKTGWGMVDGGTLRENWLPDYSNAEFETFKTELGARFGWESLTETATPAYEVTS